MQTNEGTKPLKEALLQHPPADADMEKAVGDKNTEQEEPYHANWSAADNQWQDEENEEAGSKSLLSNTMSSSPAAAPGGSKRRKSLLGKISGRMDRRERHPIWAEFKQEAKSFSGIHEAASSGNLSAVKYFLLHSSIEGTGSGKWASMTPLECACENGRADVAKLLLEEGASVEHKDLAGFTAMHWAASQGMFECVQLLADKGGNIKARSSDKITPLHLACEGGFLSIVKFLLVNGAEVNAADTHGNTPLHTAATSGDVYVVEALLGAGADPNRKNKDKITPSLVAMDETIAALCMTAADNSDAGAAATVI